MLHTLVCYPQVSVPLVCKLFGNRKQTTRHPEAPCDYMVISGYRSTWVVAADHVAVLTYRVVNLPLHWSNQDFVFLVDATKRGMNWFMNVTLLNNLLKIVFAFCGRCIAHSRRHRALPLANLGTWYQFVGNVLFQYVTFRRAFHWFLFWGSVASVPLRLS